MKISGATAMGYALAHHPHHIPLGDRHDGKVCSISVSYWMALPMETMQYQALLPL
jgi:hypothetical protein